MTILAAAVALSAWAGCGEDEGTAPRDFGPCAERPLSVSPVSLADLASVVPLGNLSPPGHVMPTEHLYFYLRLDEGGTVAVVTPVHAPGDLHITMARALEHVEAGFVDFALTAVLCNDLTLTLGHVAALSDTLFGDTTHLAGWDFGGEYSGGGETYRSWVRWFDLAVRAGTCLGTAGGNPGQWALDVGLVDWRESPGTTANPDRWRPESLHAACALDYYAEGAVHDALVALFDREAMPDDPWPCGCVHQDVPGTAHGAWFLAGTPRPNPEDNHLALVWHNTRPGRAAISVGHSVPTVASNAYLFAPADTGRLNRAFSVVTPGAGRFGYAFPVYDGVVILEMAAEDTLWIEGIPGGSTADPESWAFTGQRSIFVR